jgi:hypothetical protein
MSFGACVVSGGDSSGIPRVGGDVIERNAFALFVEVAKAGLGVGVAGLRGETN